MKILFTSIILYGILDYILLKAKQSGITKEEIKELVNILLEEMYD